MPVRRLIKYLATPQWERQHRWRHAIWRGMATLGLTGLHGLPFHGQWLDLHRRAMHMTGLHPELEGYKLVQISDLHYSPMVRKSYLTQAIDYINHLEPDLLVVTGDLLTGGHRFVAGVTSLLCGAKCRDGVVCTFGNHDYTMKGKRKPHIGKKLAGSLERELESAGLVVLRNERHTVRRGEAHFTLVGLDDEWTGAIDPKSAFDGIDPHHPIVCLNHNPVNASELLEYPWQWMLAGHTHGRPLNEMRFRSRVLRRGRPFVKGYYEVAGRHLYVNGGLSYGNRRRSANKPEITMFTLTAREGSAATHEVIG